jgi:SsrA-binding protein
MIFSTNKKVNYEYEIIESIEAGIILKGAEVKGIRSKTLSIKESFIKIIKNEVWIIGMHINLPEYAHNGFERDLDPYRCRKLLLNKKEIQKLHKKVQEKGFTLVARQVFQPENKCTIKLQICLVKGKKLYDKRETLKRKQQTMDAKREMKAF